MGAVQQSGGQLVPGTYPLAAASGVAKWATGRLTVRWLVIGKEAGSKWWGNSSNLSQRGVRHSTCTACSPHRAAIVGEGGGGHWEQHCPMVMQQEPQQFPFQHQNIQGQHNGPQHQNAPLGNQGAGGFPMAHAQQHLESIYREMGFKFGGQA